VITPVQVSPKEEELLIDWHRNGVSALVRDRALAILFSHQGRSVVEISKGLYRKPDTVRSWLLGFRKRRLSSLFAKYQGNSNAAKLTSAQKEEVAKVLGSPPSDYGIPKQFWEVKDLKKWIKAEFGAVYESTHSYHFLFQPFNYSP